MRRKSKALKPSLMQKTAFLLRRVYTQSFMKVKFLFFFFCAAIVYIFPFQFAFAHDSPISLRGKIFLQVEHLGEAWYIHPKTGERYYLKGPEEAYRIIRDHSLGISNADIQKIPTRIGHAGDKKLIDRLKGYILLQVEDHGKAWYLDPAQGVRYYLKDKDAAFAILQKRGLGITNAHLRKIPVNKEQVVFDQTFDRVAHVKYTNGQFFSPYYADHILPLASLTKLMTALVLLDMEFDWEKRITVRAQDLIYPKLFVDPDDVTSEIDLQEGDRVTFRDLWRAMLLASSNQAAGILSNNVGVTQQDFVRMMNDKAKALGLKKTIFTDPSGLDTFNIGTPREMAILAKAAFQYQEITSATLDSFTLAALRPDNTSRQVAVKNRNYSLMKFAPIAAKTGFLYEAQRNVVLKKGDAIIVVLHARSMKEKNEIIEKLIR